MDDSFPYFRQKLFQSACHFRRVIQLHVTYSKHSSWVHLPPLSLPVPRYSSRKCRYSFFIHISIFPISFSLRTHQLLSSTTSIEAMFSTVALLILFREFSNLKYQDSNLTKNSKLSVGVFLMIIRIRTLV